MSNRIVAQRWIWIAAVAVVLIAFASTFVEIDVPTDPDPRPEGGIEDIKALADRDDINVLFILIDTLRADRIQAYGYERPTSPIIDWLAFTGVRFGRNLSQSSWTKASMASMWTGLYPQHTGITRFDHVIPEEARMPAEVFRDAGFQTIGIWRNGWVADTFGFQQGFDVYVRPAGTPLPPRVRVENPTLGNRGTDDDAVRSAIEFLRVRGHDRWFLYLHLMDLHEYTYDEESAKFGTTYSDVYDNSILFTNGTLSYLFEFLSKEGYLDKTLVVLGADHGEAFRERGLEGHARAVYRETTEVPLIMSLPFKLRAPAVIESRTANLDIWPTVYDLLGLEGPKGIDGKSRLPEILEAAAGRRGGPVDSSEPLLADLDQNWGQASKAPRRTVSVVEGSTRYVRSLDINNPKRVIEELFEGESDPAELHNVAKAEPEELERLRGLALDYLDTKTAWGEEVPTRQLDEMEINQLRALGYALP